MVNIRPNTLRRLRQTQRKVNLGISPHVSIARLGYQKEHQNNQHATDTQDITTWARSKIVKKCSL